MLTFLMSLALADEAGDAWLAKVDSANNAGDDAHIVLDLKVTDAKGQAANRTIEIWQKGDDKRLVRFTAPARLEGVGPREPSPLLLDSARARARDHLPPSPFSDRWWAGLARGA